MTNGKNMIADGREEIKKPNSFLELGFLFGWHRIRELNHGSLKYN